MASDVQLLAEVGRAFANDKISKAVASGLKSAIKMGQITSMSTVRSKINEASSNSSDPETMSSTPDPGVIRSPSVGRKITVAGPGENLKRQELVDLGLSGRKISKAFDRFTQGGLVVKPTDDNPSESLQEQRARERIQAQKEAERLREQQSSSGSQQKSQSNSRSRKSSRSSSTSSQTSSDGKTGGGGSQGFDVDARTLGAVAVIGAVVLASRSS